MLKNVILRAAAAAVTLSFAAGPASADNYRVLMMDYAFFPEISYVQPGDTLTFVNVSGITRVIGARNNSWETPELLDGQEATITVTQGMPTAYITRIDGVGGNGVNTAGGGNPDVNDDLADSGDDTGQDAEEGTIIGKLNFNGAPTEVTN